MQLIPMNEIRPEVREIAIAWCEGTSPAMFIGDKHKLASDIQNYADSYADQYRDKWISIDAEKPNEPGRYLCYYTTRQDKVPHVSILSWKNILGFNGQFLVTHWQKLPPAPTV